MREGLQKVVPTDDTIVAISTPLGRSAIGIVRLSGPSCESIAGTFFQSKHPLAHRVSGIGRWTDAAGAVMDEVVATLFKAPNSYTGEDVLEVSAHGNPFVLERIVETIRKAGARLATPGEFTLRAVINGKLDLIQAEAVRSFIDAQTDEQARTALLQMEGTLSRQILPAKLKLVDIIAQLEAGIDFADDDVPPANNAAIALHLGVVLEALGKLQRSYSYGKILTDGLHVAIVGKPNVGKSSIFNRLVGINRAIVASTPGTTRDVVSESASLDGVPLRFLDTAGIRETNELVEQIGVQRTVEALSEADLVLFVVDGSTGVEDSDRDVFLRIEKRPHITLANKTDLSAVVEVELPSPSTVVRVSAKTGKGFEDLENEIRAFLGAKPERTSGSTVTNARHFDHVSSALRSVEKARDSILECTPHEMVLLDVYDALSHLNELTGEVVTEDILGKIFSTFCVGK